MLMTWFNLVPGPGVLILAAGMALLLLLAMSIDLRWGEPPAAIHPVVWMGRYLQVGGSLAVRCPPALAFVAGAVFWCLGALLVGALAWVLQSLVFLQAMRYGLSLSLGNWVVFALGILLTAWLLKSMLSWRMLRDEAGAVETALQHSLQAGRERLSMLVSRDTSALSASEVRESAIESLAENLNDSVVAPVFWFVLFGLPGAAVYRFANTADAMWGYRGVRKGLNWEWAGKWAARADDVLSWLPARLTSLLLAMACGGLRLQTIQLEARKTPSPNSGWPMAAMALALNVRLCKPGVYALNAAGRPPEATDTVLAQKYASKAVVVAVLCAQLAIIFIAIAVFP